MRKRVWISSLLCTLLSACAGERPLRSAVQFEEPITKAERACEVTKGFEPAEPIRLSHHVLVSNSEGTIPDDRHNGSFSEAFRTIMLGYAEAVQRGADKSRPPRLLFYFNGGLNSQASVEEQAARQVPCMIADGYYPVFFVWDTEGVDSYVEQVTSVWDGQIDRTAYVRARAPLIVFGNVVSGLGRAPADYFIHGRRFWRALLREPACSLIVRDLPETCPEEQRVTFVDETGVIGPDRNVAATADADAHQRETRKFLYYSLLWPARLVSVPLAHGLGEAAWTNMLRRTRTTIRRSVEFNLDRHTDWNHDGVIDGSSKCPNYFREEVRDFPKGTGTFARFFETMVRYRDGRGLPRSEWRCDNEGEKHRPAPTPQEAAKEQDQDKVIADALAKAKITLIGHSMGAIVINELLSRFLDLPYSDIVVMASAASLRDTRRVLDRYFEDTQAEGKGTHFYSLMLHPLNDTRERQYGGVVPSGSLLMWIDEMYDVPKTPEDKVFGFWPTAKAARRMFGYATQKQMLYRVFSRPHAVPREPSNPVEHGHFNEDDMCFWRPSFWGVTGTDWEEPYRKVLPEHALRRCGEKHTEPQLTACLRGFCLPDKDRAGEREHQF
jgi:hypothetical protein